MSFIAVRIGISDEDNEVDCWFRACEFHDLLKIASRTFVTDEWCLHIQFESDHAVASAISDPQCLNPRVIAHVSEHVRIVSGSKDESDGRQNLFGGDGKELNNSSILPTNNDATIYKHERRRNIFASNLVGGVWHF